MAELQRTATKRNETQIGAPKPLFNTLLSDTESNKNQCELPLDVVVLAVLVDVVVVVPFVVVVVVPLVVVVADAPVVVVVTAGGVQPERPTQPPTAPSPWLAAKPANVPMEANKR